MILMEVDTNGVYTTTDSPKLNLVAEECLSTLGFYLKLSHCCHSFHIILIHKIT